MGENESPDISAEYLAWRSREADNIAALLWPTLQQLGEANKAWLLMEIGSLDGALTRALARRLPWRDIVGIEEDSALLAAIPPHAADPALHRLDFLHGATRGEAPHLPIHRSYASGLILMGTLSRSKAPKTLLEECRRILRPGGSLILAEPIGGWFSKVPKALIIGKERVNDLRKGIEEHGFLQETKATKGGLAIYGLRAPGRIQGSF